MTGICEYCGQVVECGDVPVPDEVAWQFCFCPDARRQRKLARKIAEAMEHVDELFGDTAEQNGVDPVQQRSVVGLLKDAVAEVGAGGIVSLSCTIPGGGTAKISLGGKGEIKVTRKISRTLTMEAAE